MSDQNDTPKPIPPEEPADKGLDDAACSRLAARWRQKAADLYIQSGRMGTGFSQLPMLWRAVGNALEDCAKEIEEMSGPRGSHKPSVADDCARSPIMHYIVERRRADLGGEWKQVGNTYTTLKRAEKEARWGRASRKGMQSRIIAIPANA